MEDIRNKRVSVLLFRNMVQPRLIGNSFVTSSKHVHTPWGKALHVSLKGDDVPRPMQEALLTALELIRFEVLTNKTFSKTYTRPLGNGKKIINARIYLRLS